MNIPSSTYRVQLHREFTFQHLRNILGYLHELGISTIYAAPILKSRQNSMHGYDVVDPHEIDPEIGTLDQLREISAFLKSHGMSWLQDIVPNHMAYDPSNWRLMDVFERGPASQYYNYFDVDWDHPAADLKGKVMVPFLGRELSECIEEGEIKLTTRSDGFYISYFDVNYPLSLPAYQLIDEVKESIDTLMESAKLPVGEWHRGKAEWMKEIAGNLDSGKICNRVNDDKVTLNDLLTNQFYTFTHWKRSEHEINYRRFFTVNELICLRMEDPGVFDEYHRLIKQLYDDGLIQGVRIDHIDGLQDPSGYVKRLRRLFGPECYIIAEKILEAKESMPEDWPIEGTSGYEFLSHVSQLITDRTGAKKLVDFYRELVPQLPPYQKLVIENKRRILEHHMHGEWENLVNEFTRLELANGYTRNEIKNALGAVMVSLPVYRIYPRSLPLEGAEKRVMAETFQKAAEQNQAEAEQVRYLEQLMVRGEEQERSAVIKFEKRLMQFTGPLTAKGVEDTTFYVYNPLISHDEVGDAPSTLGITINSFHARMARRLKENPLSLNATATHDTKRGEDARLRLNVLSEIPDIWIRYVKEWMELNKAIRKAEENEVPSVNDEYFIYQSLVGGFQNDEKAREEFVERFRAFLTKALREAKQYSNWSEPNEAYENGCLEFVSGLLGQESKFLETFISFMSVIDKYSQLYSLVQVLIKVTCPGIPDIYQGCELWDLSYVDPDNRRPVDYRHRAALLTAIREREKETPHDFLAWLRAHRSEGYEKMFVTWKSLIFRRSVPELFERGDYIPLQTRGREEVVMAYARRLGDRWVVVAVPLAIARNTQADQPYADDPDDRKFAVLPDGAPKHWKNIFTSEVLTTDGKLYLFEAFKDFPVALLSGQENSNKK